VTPLPDTGTRSLIAEGTDPSWSPDGSEIYYRNGSRLMAALIDTDPGVRVLSRRLVIEPFPPPLYDDYEIHPMDGRSRWCAPWATRADARSPGCSTGWRVFPEDLANPRVTSRPGRLNCSRTI